MVRIKGASKYRQEATSNSLFLKFSTNILTVPAEMKIAEDLLELDVSEVLQNEVKQMLKNK